MLPPLSCALAMIFWSGPLSSQQPPLASGGEEKSGWVGRAIELCGGIESMYIRPNTELSLRVGWNYGNGWGAEIQMRLDRDSWLGIRGGFVNQLIPDRAKPAESARPRPMPLRDALQLAHVSSIPDAPISGRPANSNYPGAWVPQHGTHTGAILNLHRTITINGMDAGEDIDAAGQLVVPADFTPVDPKLGVVITQEFTAHAARDPDGPPGAQLWKGWTRHTFDENGITFEHGMQVSEDLENVTGYPGLSPASNLAVTTIFRSKGSPDVAISTGNIGESHRNRPITPLSTSMAFLNPETGVALVCEIPELSRILGDGPGAEQRLEERANGIVKLYNRRWHRDELKKGSSLEAWARMFLAAGINTDDL